MRSLSSTAIRSLRALTTDLNRAIAVYWITPTITTAIRMIRPMALRAGETPFLGGPAWPVAAGFCSSDIGAPFAVSEEEMWRPTPARLMKTIHVGEERL